MLVRTSDLKVREVVNTVDGRRLGFVTDLEIDLDSGQIRSITVPGQARFLGIFGRGSDFVIPWEKVKKIGLDVILVEVREHAGPEV